MDLIHECTFEMELAEPLLPGPGPFGNRVVAPLAGGRCTGKRLNGDFVAPGADWLLIGADGWGRLDVRGQLRSDDGAVIFVAYDGVLEINDKAMAAMLSSEAETAFEDQYYRTRPRLETGDERYAWVNQAVFVGRGRFTRAGVSYEVYRVD
ncbi:MAG TPA: DUF3237 domain-containing protein [Acidimicrobiales bacterium]|nr:DUF3237 domain-containing protein [Acidimicrobiales bacterium]